MPDKPLKSEFLVISRGQWDADKSPEEIQTAIDAFYTWYDRLVQEGAVKPGQRLSRQTRLVSRGGITDGPFAEAKEVIGGYWFFLADSLEEATALAAQNPCLACGLMFEVRPIELERANAWRASNEMPGAPTYFHGTKADLQVGDLIEAGYASNYGQRKQANFVYLSATLEAATWGAELAIGDGRGRIYIVEPTGTIEDDPNLTNKRFPGNPTQSYRSRHALRVIGEVTEWTGHAPERLKEMHDHLENLKQRGIEAIEE